MKPIINIVGIVMIIFGMVTLAYQGFTYTKQEKIAEIGSLKITADTEKTVQFPPILSGLCLVGGIVLVVINKKSKE